MKIIKLFFFLFLIIGVFSCRNDLGQHIENSYQDQAIATIEIVKDSLVLNGNEGNWYYKNQLFNGYAVKYYSTDSLQQKVGFFNGKKMGVAKSWFSNGAIRTVSHYNKNKLIDSYKTWWQNGVLASEANYANGKLQGVEKKWYRDGTLAKLKNLVDGKEVGLQQAWLKNGTLYVNYEAKNGRIFGMRRANSCYQLENEKVVSSKN